MIGLVPEASNLILGDVACAHCGYNLRTLASDSRCPECGKPTADSLVPDALSPMTPGTLRAIRLGLLLSVCAALIAAVSAIFSYAHVREIGIVGLFPGGGKTLFFFLAGLDRWNLSPVLFGLVVASSLVHVVGVWLLSTPMSRPILPDPSDGWRTGCRVMLFLSAACIFLGMVGKGDISLMCCGGVLALIVDATQTFLFLAYIGAIARFAGCPGIASAVGISSTCLGVVLTLIVLAGPGIVMTHATEMVTTAATAIGVLYAAAAINTMVAVIRLAMRLSKVRSLLQ